jgi:hypothetical protein
MNSPARACNDAPPSRGPNDDLIHRTHLPRPSQPRGFQLDDDDRRARPGTQPSRCSLSQTSNHHCPATGPAGSRAPPRATPRHRPAEGATPDDQHKQYPARRTQGRAQAPERSAATARIRGAVGFLRLEDATPTSSRSGHRRSTHLGRVGQQEARCIGRRGPVSREVFTAAVPGKVAAGVLMCQPYWCVSHSLTWQSLGGEDPWTDDFCH